MDTDAYLGEMGRKEQDRFSPVPTFSYKIRVCEARSNNIRRSGTAAFFWFSFPMFYTREIDAQKDDIFYKGEKSIGKRIGTRIYVLQTSGPVLLPLRKNTSRRKAFMNITQT